MRKALQVDLDNATVVVRGDYTDALKSIIEGGFCPFCEEHLFKHHKRPLLHKTKHWLVTENGWPYQGARHHFLLIPLVHVSRTEDLSPETWADFLTTYRMLITKFELTGASLLIRSGDTSLTGASVNHLHAHLIVGNPRSENAKPIKALVGFEK